MARHPPYFLASQGRKYDAKGELRDWWSPSDAEQFVARSKILVDQYQRFIVEGSPVNGQLCLGENVADLFGVKLSYAAYVQWLSETDRDKALDGTNGFTAEQRFFLAWVGVWKNTITKESALQVCVVPLFSSDGVWSSGGAVAMAVVGLAVVRLVSLVLTVCFLCPYLAACVLPSFSTAQRLVIDPHAPGECRAVGPLVHLPAFHAAWGIVPGDPMYRAPEETCEIW